MRAAKWVAEKVETVRRRTVLSWAHHKEVAALDPADQAHWLAEAEDQVWSRNELRVAIPRFPWTLSPVV